MVYLCILYYLIDQYESYLVSVCNITGVIISSITSSSESQRIWQVLIRARFNTCSRLGEGGTGAAVLDAGCLSSTGEKDWQYCIPLLFLWSFARFSSFMSRFSKSNGHDVIPCRIIGFACRPNAKQIRQVSVCDDLSMLPLATAWRSAGHCPQWQRSCLQKFASEI